MITRARNMRHLSARAGMALVIVLSSLVLISALVVAFLVRAGTESRSAASYRTTASTRQLSDMAVNLVQAQINHATGQGTTKAWASQPGAIRLFEMDGDLERVYKLYSSDLLTTNDATDLDNDVPPDDWPKLRASWVDLNAPATFSDSSGASRIVFPVLDPRDPADLGKMVTIDGFSLVDPPGATSNQPSPMPVRWLYVLQDGTMVSSATGADGDTVSIDGASKQNPIIGRIAFWTDDETCKVNINTASASGDPNDDSGAFWDIPHFNSIDDRAKGAKSQPAQREYQRYPGHPATTTLKKVFSGLGTANLFEVLPRYSYGGSNGGTTANAAGGAPAALPAKTDRLFFSVGELLFDRLRDANAIFNSQQLETSRFFLTAHSRAPEVTSFGTPRISIWPIHEADDEAHRSATDQLIAFCSTINQQPYYFTRANPNRCTADIELARNADLLGYLDRLTETDVPGVGNNFEAKYNPNNISPSERRQILTEIFDYIRCTNLRDSTVANAYADPNPLSTTDAGQGQAVPAFHSTWGTQGFGRYAMLSEVSLIFIGVGAGQSGTTAATPVTALQRTKTPYAGIDGNGKPPNDTIAVLAVLVLNYFDPSLGWSGILNNFTAQIEPASSGNGLADFKLKGSAEVASKSLGFPSSSKSIYMKLTGAGDIGTDARTYGGAVDWRIGVRNRTFANQAGGTASYPFYGSQILEIPKGSTMDFTGGTFRVNLYNGDSSNALDLIQSYEIAMPSFVAGSGQPGLPVPKLATLRQVGTGWVSGAATSRFDSANNQLGNFETTMIEKNNDVIYSVVPGGQFSDYRMLARKSVPSSAFVKHPDAGASAAGFSFCSAARDWPGSKRGVLVNQPSVITAYSTFPSGRMYPKFPFVPATVQGAYVDGSSTIPGDWDNGFGNHPDGPYINKADEGTKIRAGSTNTTPYFTDDWLDTPAGAGLFSPNRQVASAVTFGSLPTGVISQRPWQTLLFRPGPTGHPGDAAGFPKDHALLDLFWMPVAEPYAISEPFSTAGKVNLNYQIVPFTYINRNTALRSVLASERVAKIGISNASTYKNPYLYNTASMTTNARKPLNLSDTDGTLRQFKEKFASHDIFKSADEICDIFLVPQGDSWSDDDTARSIWYGDQFALVGDNVRERPYGNVYPRVTTKSNVFKVYYTVQVLRNLSANPAEWNEKKGIVMGEQSGSTTIDRNIDPNDPSIPDYATDPAAATLDTFYRWRIVESALFTR